MQRTIKESAYDMYLITPIEVVKQAMEQVLHPHPKIITKDVISWNSGFKGGIRLRITMIKMERVLNMDTTGLCISSTGNRLLLHLHSILELHHVKFMLFTLMLTRCSLLLSFVF